jgi:hypothetical protein
MLAGLLAVLLAVSVIGGNKGTVVGVVAIVVVVVVVVVGVVVGVVVMPLKNCCHFMSNPAMLAWLSVTCLLVRVFKLNWNQFFLK